MSKNIIQTGPWDDGSEATFEPFIDGNVVGFRCVVNGVVSYVMMNPSTAGGSPDVFVYQGDTPELWACTPVVFVTPEGVPEPEEVA